MIVVGEPLDHQVVQNLDVLVHEHVEHGLLIGVLSGLQPAGDEESPTKVAGVDVENACSGNRGWSGKSEI